MNDETCKVCATWGRTITDTSVVTIPCPACGRRTWPNQGVNCPAGSAVSFGCANVYMTLQALEDEKKRT